MKCLQPPLLLFSLPAVLVALCPAAHDALLYDRAAIAHAELWRLWTGHWVHFSRSHLLWNLLVLLPVGAWLEKLQPGRLLRYVLVAAPLSSLGFLGLAPGMQTYGGLSGLATGAVTLLALAQLARNRGDRVYWLAVLLLVAAKIILETGRSRALFSDFSSPAMHVSALAHAAGAGLALAFFLSRRRPFCLPLKADTALRPAPAAIPADETNP